MMGVVEIYKGDKKVIEEPNMLMDNIGKSISFWMSLPRAFSGVETASSIYDTSNYSVRAASLGKDAAGYSNHGHSSYLKESIISDGIFRVYAKGYKNYINLSSLSYQVERDHVLTPGPDTRLKLINSGIPETSAFMFSGSFYAENPVLPEYSNPTMQRLETNSTKPSSYLTSAVVPDVGHNLNFTISGNSYKPVGCYAPGGSITYYLLSSLPNGIACQDTIFNNTGFNSNLGVTAKAIDSRGFIRTTVSSIKSGQDAINAGNYYLGLLLGQGADFEQDLEVHHVLGITQPDFLALNFFGGVYTIGLWGYDVEGMISKGMYPPFSQYDINSLDYKLFARKTFNRDLTFYEGTTTDFSEIQTLKINWRFKFR